MFLFESKTSEHLNEIIRVLEISKVINNRIGLPKHLRPIHLRLRLRSGSCRKLHTNPFEHACACAEFSCYILFNLLRIEFRNIDWKSKVTTITRPVCGCKKKNIYLIPLRLLN